jgi:hypothetical protein
VEVDCSVRVLHLLHSRRVSDIDPRQTSPIQPRNSSHHILLGSRLPLHWVRSKLWWSRYHSHIPRVLRRLLVSFHDTIPLQLVSARGTWFPCRIPVHRLGTERRFWRTDRLGSLVHGWCQWLVWMAMVCSHFGAMSATKSLINPQALRDRRHNHRDLGLHVHLLGTKEL